MWNVTRTLMLTSDAYTEKGKKMFDYSILSEINLKLRTAIDLLNKILAELRRINR